MIWFIPFETERYRLPVEATVFIENMKLATGDNRNPLVKRVPFRNLLRGYTLQKMGSGFKVIAKSSHRKTWSGRIFARFFSDDKVRFWYRPSIFSIMSVTLLWVVLGILVLVAYLDFQNKQYINTWAIGVFLVGLIFQLFQLNRIFTQIQKMKLAVKMVINNSK